jgi:GT2 family glycosyltransferase
VRSMTLGIASFDRRASVVRLVRALGEQLVDDPETQAALDLLVVLDGSRDGSLEALESAELPVPLRVIWQPNRGLAAARNRIVDAAHGETVLFLDDDMVPSPRLIARHRRAQEANSEALVMGACLYPEEWFAFPAERRYWEAMRLKHAATGTVDRFDDFSCANTSGPVQIFREVGGFDEDFRGYGPEDAEFAYRLLDAGYLVRFEPDAVAWHHQARSPRQACRITIAEHRNYVRMVARHPGAAVAIPLESPSGRRRLLCRIGGRSPWRYAAVCYLLSLAVTPRTVGTPLGARLAKWSKTAGRFAGLFAEDPTGRLAARACRPRAASADTQPGALEPSSHEADRDPAEVRPSGILRAGPPSQDAL